MNVATEKDWIVVKKQAVMNVRNELDDDENSEGDLRVVGGEGKRLGRTGEGECSR